MICTVAVSPKSLVLLCLRGWQELSGDSESIPAPSQQTLVGIVKDTGSRQRPYRRVFIWEMNQRSRPPRRHYKKFKVCRIEGVLLLW